MTARSISIPQFVPPISEERLRNLMEGFVEPTIEDVPRLLALIELERNRAAECRRRGRPGKRTE